MSKSFPLPSACWPWYTEVLKRNDFEHLYDKWNIEWMHEGARKLKQEDHTGNHASILGRVLRLRQKLLWNRHQGSQKLLQLRRQKCALVDQTRCGKRKVSSVDAPYSVTTNHNQLRPTRQILKFLRRVFRRGTRITSQLVIARNWSTYSKMSCYEENDVNSFSTYSKSKSSRWDNLYTMSPNLLTSADVTGTTFHE